MPQRPVGPTCQKLNPLKLKAISARMRLANCRRRSPRNSGWAGSMPPPPLRPPLSRAPFPGSTGHTQDQERHSLHRLWFSGGAPSLFSEASPLRMNNFIFWSVNPPLPCYQHTAPETLLSMLTSLGPLMVPRTGQQVPWTHQIKTKPTAPFYSESSLCITFKE